MSQNLMDGEGERVPKIIKIGMIARIKNSLKNWWFWKPKFKKIVKQTLLKTMFFSRAFFNRFWKGLGRVLGGSWEGFGSSWASLGALLDLFL